MYKFEEVYNGLEEEVKDKNRYVSLGLKQEDYADFKDFMNNYVKRLYGNGDLKNYLQFYSQGVKMPDEPITGSQWVDAYYQYRKTNHNAYQKKWNDYIETISKDTNKLA